MKKILLFVCIAIFSGAITACSFAAPAVRDINLTRVQTVNDVKKISFPYKPIPVAAEPTSGSTDSGSSSGYTPSDKYSTGSGLILTPAYLVDAASVSTLALFNANYNYTTQAQMNDASAPFATLTIPPVKASSTFFSTIVFGRMAKEAQTYVLTLKMEKLTPGGSFRIRIGDTEFSGDQVVYNSTTKEHRVLFSFAPPLSQMNVLVYYVNSNQTSDAQIKFHYAQLVRLD